MTFSNRLRAIALAATCMVFSACGGDDSTNPDDTPVGTLVAATTSNTFNPSSVTIAVGGTVTWQFGAVEHNIVFSSGAGAPSNVSNSRNKNVSRTFGTAGTFGYVCNLHSGMAGTVIVN